MKKIGILYVCTGKYSYYFNDFYLSCEKYFLPNMEKIYYVFTDKTNLSNATNVKIITQKCQGFPNDSLFKFEYFISIKEQLITCDYLFFFNSNALFLDIINEDYLPSESDGNLLGAEWVAWKGKHPAYFPYERRKESKAYIEPGKPPYHYYMGGVNGGRTKEYLELSETLARNIRDDYERGIIAKFHDESHINRYFRDHKCKVLTPEYCMPEEWANGQKLFMMIRNKSKLSNEFDMEKGRNIPFIRKVYDAYIKKHFVALQWYL